jgi:Family of unknown function (DUF5320)
LKIRKEVSAMPLEDGTGPAGLGPMTGRAAGYCAGYSVPGYMNPIGGRGFWGGGRGFGGGGRGRRNWFYATGLTGWQRAGYGYPAYGGATLPYAAPYAAPYTAPFIPAASGTQEVDMLKGQAEYLEDALSGINKRIQELEAEEKQK